MAHRVGVAVAVARTGLRLGVRRGWDTLLSLRVTVGVGVGLGMAVHPLTWAGTHTGGGGDTVVIGTLGMGLRMRGRREHRVVGFHLANPIQFNKSN